MSAENDDDKGGGYGSPPRSTRFAKGVSANPAGRPKGSKRLAPYEDILGQMMQITDEGITRRAPVHEVLQRRLLELALDGNNAAVRAVEALAMERQSNQASDELTGLERIIHFVTPGNVTMALEPLKMGRIPALQWVRVPGCGAAEIDRNHLDQEARASVSVILSNSGRNSG